MVCPSIFRPMRSLLCCAMKVMIQSRHARFTTTPSKSYCRLLSMMARVHATLLLILRPCARYGGVSVAGSACARSRRWSIVLTASPPCPAPRAGPHRQTAMPAPVQSGDRTIAIAPGLTLAAEGWSDEMLRRIVHAVEDVLAARDDSRKGES